MAISVSSSRLKLFTGGRFNDRVAIPDLSFTSRLISFVAATDKERVLSWTTTGSRHFSDWRNILLKWRRKVHQIRNNMKHLIIGLRELDFDRAQNTNSSLENPIKSIWVIKGSSTVLDVIIPLFLLKYRWNIYKNNYIETIFTKLENLDTRRCKNQNYGLK